MDGMRLDSAGQSGERDDKPNDYRNADVVEKQAVSNENLVRGSPELTGELEKVTKTLCVELHEVDNLPQRGTSAGRRTLVVNSTL